MSIPPYVCAHYPSLLTVWCSVCGNLRTNNKSDSLTVENRIVRLIDLNFDVGVAMPKFYPSAKYLEHAMNLSDAEVDLRDLYQHWLPAEIIDCHVHTNGADHVIGLDEGILQRPLSTFPDFDLKHSLFAQRVFYPNKKVRMLRFANAYRGIDHRSVNNYLIAESPQRDRVALYGIPTDIEYTVRMLQQHRVTALKMYYMFFDPPAKHIYEFFPKPILEEAQFLGIPIILHPPITIMKCMDQMMGLIRDFPRLKIVLAHLGLYSEPIDGLRQAYEELGKYPNVYGDTAMVSSSIMVKWALEMFGTNRVMYGSDEPLSYIRSVLHGTRMISEYPYHWVRSEDSEKYGYLAKNANHAHWQTLGAIKDAISGLPFDQQESAISKVFYENAKDLFRF